jgi:hypothetical protein
MAYVVSFVLFLIMWHLRGVDGMYYTLFCFFCVACISGSR